MKLSDIALHDIRMPGAQGHEIGARMRPINTTKEIPIVIMTAYQLTQEKRNRVIEMLNPEHIIVKPLPASDDLRRMLEKIVADATMSQTGLSTATV